MGIPDSSGLKYDSIETLQRYSALPDDQTKRFNRSKCEELLTKMDKLEKQAAQSRGDLEAQFVLYFRAAEIGKIIGAKNGFETFKSNKANNMTFFSLFKKSVEECENLKAILSKKYEERHIRSSSTIPQSVSPSPTSSPAISQKPVTTSLNNVSISPKELVRLVERGEEDKKKSAVILDFRLDKSGQICYNKKGDQITVIKIPNELVERGVLFNTLKNGVDVGQRALFTRMSFCDLVVLMDETSPPLQPNGELVQGSKADLIRLAVTDYNNECRPRNRPLVMDGGFATWHLQFPSYTQYDASLRLREPKDKLDFMVSNYTKARVNVEYADLSPKRPPPPVAQSDPNVTYAPLRTETTFPVDNNDSNGITVSPIPSYSNGHGSTVNGASGISYVTNGVRVLTTTPTPKPYQAQQWGSEASNRPNSIIPPTIVPAVPPHRTPSSTSPVASGLNPTVSVGGVAVTSNGTSVSSVSPSKPIIPSVDRTKKPMIPEEPFYPPPPPSEPLHQSQNSKPTTTPIPIPARPGFGVPFAPQLDRTTKPVVAILSNEKRNMLLDIFRSMIENIEGNMARRATHPRPGCTGLNNMGNTCFMNATLQALFHTPKMADVFTKENFLSKINPVNKMNTGGVITSVFSALMDIIWSGQYTCIRPQRFLKLFADMVTPILADGNQHDASEFMIFLLDSLHEDTNEVMQKVNYVQDYRGGDQIEGEAIDFLKKCRQWSFSPVHSIFSMQTASEIKCLSCGERSATFDMATLLSVELPSSSSRTSLSSCLASHFTETRLEGDCRWMCPRCNEKRDAMRTTRLWSLPSVLVVHLKRFSMYNGDYTKNTISVEFDTNRLDLRPYVHPKAISAKSDEIYRLYAVTLHRGRLNSGHYTAVVCHATTGEWLKFDDEDVASFSANRIDNSDAYMLYYKKSNR